MGKTYISDIIKKEDIKSWKPEQPVIISAQTGKGKSWFIMHELYELAQEQEKKILLLVHRTRIQEQFEHDLGDRLENGIDVMTYQKVNYALAHTEEIDLSEYDYIVCDEFHFFISDSEFNYITDLSFDLIMEQDAVKIFMSATSQKMARIVKKRAEAEVLEYTVPSDYSYIEELTFFRSPDQIRDIIDNIPDGEKAIAFINSLERGAELYEHYRGSALFACSRNAQPKYVNLMKEKKITAMLDERMFHEKILITTTVLDAGVTIEDPAVKHIIIDIKDADALIQCLGRKRLVDDTDKVKVYVRDVKGRQLGGMMKRAFDKIKEAEFLTQCGQYSYYDEYVAERRWANRGIVYVDPKGVYHVNRMIASQCKASVEEYRTILGNDKEVKFSKDDHWQVYIAGLLQQRYWCIMTEENAWLEQAARMRKIFPHVKDRQELIQAAGVRDKKGRLLKSRDIINAYFDERELPYRIEYYNGPYGDREKNEYLRNAWQLVHTTDIPEWIEDDYVEYDPEHIE